MGSGKTVGIQKLTQYKYFSASCQLANITHLAGCIGGVEPESAPRRPFVSWRLVVRKAKVAEDDNGNGVGTDLVGICGRAYLSGYFGGYNISKMHCR